MPDALMPKLEAVNIILRSIGSSPLSSLANNNDLESETAVTMLDETSKTVQSEGWHFNTEEEVPFLRNTANEIELPRNVLKIDSPYVYKDFIQKGLKLYDRKNRRYTFTEDPKMTVVSYIDWDELPQQARYYIALKAARFYQEQNLGSDLQSSMDRDEEQRALVDLRRSEDSSSDTNILNNPSVALTTSRRNLFR